MKWLWLWICIISAISVIITVYDKIVSMRRKSRRISEKSLMITALLGGCAAMYVTMQITRHKINKAKFMVGLPIMILLYGAVLILVIL